MVLDEELKRRQRSSYILKKKGTPSGVQPFKLHLASSDTGMKVCADNRLSHLCDFRTHLQVKTYQNLGNLN